MIDTTRLNESKDFDDKILDSLDGLRVIKISS